MKGESECNNNYGPQIEYLEDVIGDLKCNKLDNAVHKLSSIINGSVFEPRVRIWQDE